MAVNYTNGRYSATAPSAADTAAAAKERNRLIEEDRVRRNAAAYNSPIAGDYMGSHGGQAASMIADTKNSYDTAVAPLFSGAGSGGNGDLSQSQQNWNSAIDMTRGRGDATMNDPRIKAALDRLQKNTEEGPYSPGVVNQMSNRMADRTAAVGANQAAALREQVANRGGSMNDPSFQAALNASNTGRMQQNNADRGDLESKATVTNYGAQGQAAQALAGTRLGQLSHADDMYGQAGNMYANQQTDSGQRQSTVPSFSPSFNGGGEPTQSKPFQSMWSPGTWGGNTGGGNGGNGGGDNGYQTQDNGPAVFKPQLVPKPQLVTKPVTRPPGYNNLLTGQHITNGYTEF